MNSPIKHEPLQPEKNKEGKRSHSANPVLSHLRSSDLNQVETWMQPAHSPQLGRPLYGNVKCITPRQ